MDDSNMTEQKAKTVVLLSGGIDSSTALALTAQDTEARLSSLFVDFGQPAAVREKAASRMIAQELGATHRSLSLKGTSFSEGEIKGRNGWLAHTALLCDASVQSVIIGIHAGTAYPDCGPDFVDVIQRSFDLHTGGSVSLVAPFVDWTKGQVYGLAMELGVPISSTYSCEAGGVSCRRCRSCLDRDALLSTE